MSFRVVLTLLVLGAAACCGCRTNPHVASFIENRNSEARQLEDEYWLQVQENERLAYELAKLKRQRAKLEGGIEPPLIEEGTSPPRVEEGTQPPLIEVPEMPSSPEKKKPQIEPEPPPRPGGAADEDSPAVLPDRLPPPRDEKPPRPTQPEVIDEKVTHLFLNPLHTGGVDLDHRPGDDGLSLLVEPRNAADQFVPLAGNISVVLLDPQQSGDAARIARWNFDTGETKQAIRQEGDARGIRLEMPWPSRVPESSQLRLFVRYETADGRKFQTEREVFIKLAGQYSERWTPRPPERQRRNQPVHSAIAQPSQSAAPSPAAPSVAAQPAMAEPKPAASSPPAVLTPPPALSEAPGAAPSRPTWKPYR
jgi:hypothetical protein